MAQSVEPAQPAAGAAAAQQPALPRNVVAAGLSSLFTDISSEMIVPVLPLFLTSVLGASPFTVGLIEGVAEATASLLKAVSGWWSDRLSRRKPFMLFGYGLSNLVKPLFALSTSWPQVLVVRFADRFGKGVRGAPRDALIADSVPANARGRAFGFHRMLDTIGAAIGPLLAFGLIRIYRGDYRHIFWWAGVPGIASVIILAFLVREPRNGGANPAAPAGVGQAAADPDPAGRRHVPLGPAFGWLAVVSTLFALGNSSDAFLILRAQNIGLPALLVPLAYFSFNAVYSALSWPAGSWSDRIGRRPLLVAGYLFFGLIYLGFALANKAWQVWPLFALYGLYYAATEGIQKALVVDVVPAGRRGTAIGLLNALTGVAAFPASLVAGYLWQRFGFAWSFYYGAGAAFLAATGLLIWPYERLPVSVQ